MAYFVEHLVPYGEISNNPRLSKSG
ncbi:uncharacterized protein METZ01_LOCUS373471, partial [marine metagenome]